MPGTLVRDALAANLLSGATLNAAGSTNGTVVELTYPGEVSFVLETATVTGASPTLDVVIQGSDVSGFGSGVVTYGQMELTGTGADQSNQVRRFTTYAHHRFVRAVVTLGGTSPVYTGSIVAPRQPHDRRTKTTTA